MSTYVCFHCNSTVEVNDVNSTFYCPVCSGKILFKETPKVVKRVKCI